MLDKIYKVLKANFIPFLLKKILKQNLFLGFFFLTNLNATNLKKLRKIFFVLKLKILICKNNYLKKSNLLIPVEGYSVILYSPPDCFFFENTNISLLYPIGKTDNFFPLIVCSHNRIFYFHDFLTFCEKSRFTRLTKTNLILLLQNVSFMYILRYLYEFSSKFKKSKISHSI